MSRETVTSSEIAVLAGVHRSSVSKWKQRHDDFPKPLEGSDVYDRAAIQKWLTEFADHRLDLAQRAIEIAANHLGRTELGLVEAQEFHDRVHQIPTP